MEFPDYLKRAMLVFRTSFINRNNELILIPRFNVYFGLNDIETEEDFLCKMCEWFSRDCCCAMRYKSRRRLEKYWSENTGRFNVVCKTDFEVFEMQLIYDKLGNRINHNLTKKFVRSGFDLRVLGVDTSYKNYIMEEKDNG